jgi:uracil-DNA glycosylase
MSKLPNIDSSWNNVLLPEFEKNYYIKIKEKIVEDINEGKTIYPPLELVFNAFKETDFNNLKVVLLGQDPYHGKNQAHGLSFSVQESILLPPSLKNIFKELKDDLGYNIPKN